MQYGQPILKDGNILAQSDPDFLGQLFNARLVHTNPTIGRWHRPARHMPKWPWSLYEWMVGYTYLPWLVSNA